MYFKIAPDLVWNNILQKDCSDFDVFFANAIIQQ